MMVADLGGVAEFAPLFRRGARQVLVLPAFDFDHRQ